MYDWEKFSERSLPEKKHFYSHLNMEYITYADFTRAKRDSKNFEIKNLGKYHDLHFQSDTLLVADVLNIIRNMCLDKHGLDPAHIFPHQD